MNAISENLNLTIVASIINQASTNGGRNLNSNRNPAAESVNGMTLKENEIEQKLINKLEELKYTYRPEIHDKATLEANVCEYGYFQREDGTPDPIYGG